MINILNHKKHWMLWEVCWQLRQHINSKKDTKLLICQSTFTIKYECGTWQCTVSAAEADLFIKMDICIWIELVVSAFHPALKACNVKDGAAAREVQPEPTVVKQVSKTFGTWSVLWMCSFCCHHPHENKFIHSLKGLHWDTLNLWLV